MPNFDLVTLAKWAIVILLILSAIGGLIAAGSIMTAPARQGLDNLNNAYHGERSPYVPGNGGWIGDNPSPMEWVGSRLLIVVREPLVPFITGLGALLVAYGLWSAALWVRKVLF